MSVTGQLYPFSSIPAIHNSPYARPLSRGSGINALKVAAGHNLPLGADMFDPQQARGPGGPQASASEAQLATPTLAWVGVKRSFHHSKG